MPGPDALSSPVAFPAGPTYPELLDSDHGPGWVRFKVWSADWYTATLETLVRDLPDLRPHVGVEMSLDGALSALSGAFDAAVALMITSAEESLDLPKDERLAAHAYGWVPFTAIANGRKGNPGLDLEKLPQLSDLWSDIDLALEGHNVTDPIGWLAILRRIRNVPTHRRALARTWTIDIANDSIEASLSDFPEGDAVTYLKASCDQVSDLTERMISIANSFGYVGANTPLVRQPWTASA